MSIFLNKDKLRLNITEPLNCLVLLYTKLVLPNYNERIGRKRRGQESTISHLTNIFPSSWLTPGINIQLLLLILSNTKMDYIA